MSTLRFGALFAADVGSFSGNLAENVGVTDAIVVTHTAPLAIRNIAESVGVTDALVVENTLYRIIGDDIGTADAASRSADYKREVGDDVGVSDAVTILEGILQTVAIAETVGLTDAVVYLEGILQSVVIGDDVGAADALALAYGLQEILGDNVGVTDAVSYKTANFDHIRNIAETILARDPKPTLGGTKKVYIADQIFAWDSTFRTGYVQSVVIGDSVGVSDAKGQRAGVRAPSLPGGDPWGGRIPGLEGDPDGGGVPGSGRRGGYITTSMEILK